MAMVPQDGQMLRSSFHGQYIRYMAITRILEEQYESMKAGKNILIRESGNSCVLSSGFHFGDWLAFAEYYSYNYNAPDYDIPGPTLKKI